MRFFFFLAVILLAVTGSLVWKRWRCDPPPRQPRWMRLTVLSDCRTVQP